MSGGGRYGQVLDRSAEHRARRYFHDLGLLVGVLYDSQAADGAVGGFQYVVDTSDTGQQLQQFYLILDKVECFGRKGVFADAARGGSGVGVACCFHLFRVMGDYLNFVNGLRP